MSKIYSCSICNSSFKNAGSLYTHRYRYHPKPKRPISDEDETSNNNYEKHLQPHPAFGYDINQSRRIEDGDRTKKRYRSDEALSEESEIDHERYIKRAKSVDDNETSRDDKKVESLEKKIVTLEKVVAGLVRNIKKVPTEFRKVREDVDKELENYYRKYTEQLPTLFEQIIEVQRNFDKLIKNHRDFKEDLMRKDPKVIRKDVENMETVFNNSLEIRNLFKDNKYDIIKFKIKKLRNAALTASKGLADVTEKERELLGDLSKASIFEAKNLLEQHYITLKSIFITLPPYENVKAIVTEVKEDLTSKNKSEIGGSFNSNEEHLNNDNMNDKEPTDMCKDGSIEDEVSQLETNEDKEALSAWKKDILLDIISIC